jgi:hypothetical protein
LGFLRVLYVSRGLNMSNKNNKTGFFYYYFHSTALSVAHTVREVVFKIIVTYKLVGLVDWRGSTPRQSDRLKS